ncbi:UDP-N-acetylenolpyruvoylglucosamine reductase [Mycolicibacterium hippocampi]|uniref:UDP-N-acetylenolpyruvoylglucosamine reductase n=2 Tax=Mycobacteriaceae TaxID=1762 RepID=A0A850PN50_9MYCO|nr:UDP-N-acetylmuramate dehydrogenase [Mycolicibacterium hippocampi]NVN52048.1 UDP-N-acetylenolpyruvoylglucosamine reductase [Mycolicibacterium hippocampi]
MRLGGDAAEYAAVHTTADLVEAVSAADVAGTPVVVLGEGSNLVVGDGGFDGIAVHVRTGGFDIDGATVTVDAGVHWDDVVTRTLDAGLGGLEPLSGVPGSTGGTPVQNVGAYGALVSQFLHDVQAFDRRTREIVTIPGGACGFGSHRQSIFKHSDRWVILSVRFALDQTGTSRPIVYAGLAQRLALNVGDVAATDDVRAAVLELRRERAMLLDADDHDTWSVGSFFINPVLPSIPVKARDCPTYPDVAGVKLPAGWLIDHAGFAPGYGAQWGRGRVRLSTKHALAVTNRGGATTGEVMAFAAHIREGVERAFDVRLGPECDLVNCSFDDPAPEWLAAASAN